MRLQGRTAIITGGAGGIGRAIAERFISEGASVMLADINEAGLKAVAKELDCPWQRTDVAKKADIVALVDAAAKQFPAIDIVVNNAGVIHAADLLDLEEDDFDRVLAINLKSAFLLSQAAARLMIPRKSGSIINMSSVNAILAIPNQIPYAVSKGGLNQLTKVMSIGLAPHGIRVNGIGPGTIDTAIASAVITDAAAERRVMSRTPLGRRGEAAEVASVAAFLASDDASYITGQTIYPDGGRLGLNYTM